jgi:hypothetical protein
MAAAARLNLPITTEEILALYPNVEDTLLSEIQLALGAIFRDALVVPSDAAEIADRASWTSMGRQHLEALDSALSRVVGGASLADIEGVARFETWVAIKENVLWEEGEQAALQRMLRTKIVVPGWTQLSMLEDESEREEVGEGSSSTAIVISSDSEDEEASGKRRRSESSVATGARNSKRVRGIEVVEEELGKEREVAVSDPEDDFDQSITELKEAYAQFGRASERLARARHGFLKHDSSYIYRK